MLWMEIRIGLTPVGEILLQRVKLQHVSMRVGSADHNVRIRHVRGAIPSVRRSVTPEGRGRLATYLFNQMDLIAT